MARFNELPVILQFFLSDWIDEILDSNKDTSIDRDELSECLFETFEQFGVVFAELLKEVKSEPRPDGAPFHAVIGYNGLQFRSKADHSIITDDFLFNFKMALLKIPFWEVTLQHKLKSKFGNIEMSLNSFRDSLPDFLNSLAQQISLTCIFPVPPPDGDAHENSASFKVEDNKIKAVCKGNETHSVTFQA